MTDYDEMFADSMEASSSLSAAGQARRDAMKDALTAAVVTRRRRRTATRWAAAAVLLLAVGGLGWQVAGAKFGFGSGSGSDGGDPVRTERETTPTIAQTDTREPSRDRTPAQPARVTIVRDDDAIVARLAGRSGASRVQLVDDEALLALLDAADRRTGLIRSGRTVRLTRSVTDPVASLR